MREKKEQVSVIIPVYNTEQYLSECIDSVLSQTYRNLEIILIDDGSTDRSPQICDQYAKEDMRIQVIHLPHQGTSTARNAGLSVLQGKYVVFCDSDDRMECNMIECLVKNLQDADADLSVCALTREWNLADREMDSKVETISAEEAVLYVLDNPLCSGYIANKLFKSEILRRYLILFDPLIAMLEDQLFVLQYIQFCRKVCLTDRILYFYRNNPVSISNQKYDIRTITLIFAKEKILNVLRNSIGTDEAVCMKAWNDLMRTYVYWHKELLFMHAPEKKQWITYIRKQFPIYKKLYSYDDQWTFKGKLCRLMLAVCAKKK